MREKLVALANEVIRTQGLMRDRVVDPVSGQLRLAPNTAAGVKRMVADGSRLSDEERREIAESLGENDRFRVTPDTMLVLSSLSRVHSDAALALAIMILERLEDIV